MIIHAHIIIYNEQRILPYLLSHYQGFCDKIFIYDNNSTDASESIYRACPIVEAQKFEFTQSKIDETDYLRIKNNCWKNSDADFVIVCDADEFLVSDNILTSLSYCRRHGITLPPVTGFQMVAEKMPVYDVQTPYLIDLIYQGVPLPEKLNKSIIFNPREITEINYLAGCHQCMPEGNICRVASRDAIHRVSDETMDYPPFMLWHYKYIDREYIKERHRIYNSRLSQFNRLRGYGAEYAGSDADIDKLINHYQAMADVCHVEPIGNMQ